MANQLERFAKRKNYLVFVDSDGCAMDTMERKHTQCFGPGLVAEWGLEPARGLVLSRWNEINLYSMTRGINRFEGLALILKEISDAGGDIPGLDDLLRWTSAGGVLNHRTLRAEIEQTDSICLKKALLWSREVNRQVALLPKEDRRPFEGVQRALARAHRYADVAVISNAPLETVLEEWDMYGLLEHTDIVLAEDCGSKERCIAGLLEMGYSRDHVLACGDACDDLRAAERSGVFFYPILVKHENESWAEFASDGLNCLRTGTYAGAYQQEKIEQFLANLSK